LITEPRGEGTAGTYLSRAQYGAVTMLSTYRACLTPGRV